MEKFYCSKGIKYEHFYMNIFIKSFYCVFVIFPARIYFQVFLLFILSS